MIRLDLGTTKCKAVLLDAEKRVRAIATDCYKLQIPHPRQVQRFWAFTLWICSVLTNPLCRERLNLARSIHQIRKIIKSTNNTIVSIEPYAMAWRLWVKPWRI